MDLSRWFWSQEMEMHITSLLIAALEYKGLGYIDDTAKKFFCCLTQIMYKTHEKQGVNSVLAS